MIQPIPSHWQPQLLSVLRIISAYLFLLHGTAKYFGVPKVPYFDNLQVFSLVGVAGIIEIVFGILLLIGLFSRLSAFVLSGLAAFAYFIGHASKGNFFFPMLNGGESAVLFCFAFLYLCVAGPGPWSVDAARQRA